MPKVIYNGNGNTGGSVPCRQQQLRSERPLYRCGTRQPEPGKQPFLPLEHQSRRDRDGLQSWLQYVPPNQATNLTLFAIWGVTTGLTYCGVTTHFNFFFTLRASAERGGVEPARINQVLAAGTGGKPVIENDFDWLQAQFAGIDMTKRREPFRSWSR